MIKATFKKDKLHLWSLGITFQGGRDFVEHPYRKMRCYYPICAMIIMLAKWQFTMAIFKPANITFNRAERRANHMK